MILKQITANFTTSDEFKELKSKLKNNEKFSIEGISSSSFPMIISSIFLESTKPLLVVTKNSQKMQVLANDIANFIDDDLVFPFPAWEMLPYEFVTPAESIERDRIKAIYKMLNNDPCIYVSTVESLMRKIPSKEHLQTKAVHLNIDEEFPFDDILEMLVFYGYERVTQVETFGQFAVKGGIIDIFLPSNDNPVRLDFFGDSLESIREFDSGTQISQAKLNEIHIYPRKETVLSQQEKEKIINIYKSAQEKELELPDAILENIENNFTLDKFPGIEDLFPGIIETSSIIDYLGENINIIFIDYQELFNQKDSIVHTYNELYDRKNNETICLKPSEIISHDILQNCHKKSIDLNVFTSSSESLKWNLKSINSFQGKVAKLREDLQEKLEQNWKIIVSTAFDGQARRLNDILAKLRPDSNYDIYNPENNLNIILSNLSQGLEITNLKTLILTDHDIFGKSYRKRKSFKKRTSRPIDTFLELKPEDPVVHINHGIGIFKKIERMTAGGIERDFIVIEYNGGDKLYVPLDQLNLIQKYIGLDSDRVRIDSLGKKSAWNKIKAKVQESIEEIARELIEIYAKRKSLKGFSYPEDTVWQEEFEAKFQYEETPDQLSAIEDVKDDMESDLPMDRLICGDVGFGKTEVAIRASFKAVMAGKQVIVLVPTTVLAMQHFRTFKKRFIDYPIKIEMISRFRSRSQINETKLMAAEGKVDIIIGTHGLLAKDISYKNAGLLIIDEEQRFGVKHKEQLKKFRTQIDSLSMSATPIPRTLHMSMAGIRDLSIIATPPENRQSVETYVLEDNPDIIKMAITKEIERDGQVFFIHNRVDSIDAQADIIQNLIPEAVIAVAHGQMNEHELEEVMVDFLEGRYNILISTTIIESGLDMPNVNTIIINRADALGLSQLYQLKGRVGRSDKKGYAYFFYPRHIPLTEVAQKRLRVISEYSDLGSGFKIAMKDLEIRGSGNILGKEQSGSIMEVGFDLYCQMLDEAVRKLKGENPLNLFRTTVSFKTNVYIPENYISDTRQKIEFYKRFESCETLEEISDMSKELTDRFGPIPDEVKILILLEEIRTLGSMLYIIEVIEDNKLIKIRFSGESKINMQTIIKMLKKDHRLQVDPADPEIIKFYPTLTEIEKKLDEFKKWLQQIS